MIPVPEKEQAPNPGSLEAENQGCLCPVLDNARGRGVPTSDGVAWWINSQCPLHGDVQNREQNDD